MEIKINSGSIIIDIETNPKTQEIIITIDNNRITFSRGIAFCNFLGAMMMFAEELYDDSDVLKKILASSKKNIVNKFL